MNAKSPRSRYKSENGVTIIEFGVKTVRQLFDARDPAPFRERDLDDDLVRYILSGVQEFSLSTPIRLRVQVSEESRSAVDLQSIRDAFQTHFEYEATLLRRRLIKTLQTGRMFFGIGVVTLVTCLSLAELVVGRGGDSALFGVLSEGLVISGWVAMWRPLEVFLYDWWPIRELKLYHEKLAKTEVEIVCQTHSGQPGPEIPSGKRNL